MRVAWDSLAASGKMAWKRAVKSGPMLSGICMPARKIFSSGFCSRALATMPSRFFCFLRRDAAQAVVAAERDDKDVGSFCHGPSDAAQPVGGGVAADSGIGDGVREFGGGDLFLEQKWVGLVWIKSVADGDAVPEEHDAIGGRI